LEMPRDRAARARRGGRRTHGIGSRGQRTSFFSRRARRRTRRVERHCRNETPLAFRGDDCCRRLGAGSGDALRAGRRGGDLRAHRREILRRHARRFARRDGDIPARRGHRPAAAQGLHGSSDPGDRGGRSRRILQQHRRELVQGGAHGRTEFVDRCSPPGNVP